jgi:hypothetical protein
MAFQQVIWIKKDVLQACIIARIIFNKKLEAFAIRLCYDVMSLALFFHGQSLGC